MKLLKINDFLKIEKLKESKIERSNFRFAFYLLPKEKRIAISNFYLFCSYLDNIIDNNDTDIIEKQNRLLFWKEIVKNIYNNKNNNPNLAILKPLSDVFYQYSIPYNLIEALIDGIGKDLKRNRYNIFDELLEYCYGVASVVGLICIYIFTDNKINDNLKQYAIHLGYALQLTNIMRDIAEDYNRNYIYIPQNLLSQFNYTEQNISNNIYNNDFSNLMNCLYDTANSHYNTANSFIENENKNILRSAEAMKRIYFNLLQKIKKNNFNIYKKKIKISNLEKLFLLLRT